MESRLNLKVALSLLLVLFWCTGAAADYKADIGFTQLQTELGSSTPTGTGVPVAQVEAGSLSDGVDYYLPFLPGSTATEFKNKTITPTLTPYGVSGHASGVGTYFYGNITSIAPGINSIYGYDAGDWVGSGFLDTYGGQPLISSARVANHSWAGYNTLSDNVTIDPPANVDTLKRLDWVIQRDEYIQVVAMYNGSGRTTMPLLGSSFNAIAVGLSNGNSQNGSYALDSLYTAGRTRPDLVAPAGATSYATPMVSAAASLLVEVGHTGGTKLSTDPLVKSTTNRSGETIYNAERTEVVKAALMAGADRLSPNLTNSNTKNGYTVNTANGLNDVYGAGQLNIYNCYHIIAAGEQNSLQDGGSGNIGCYGFDYDPYFGGGSVNGNVSNRTASYYFTTTNAGQMTASLVWNLDVGTPTSFNSSATLYNLGLYLYDLTTEQLVGSATSLVDNTENLWLSLNASQNYRLQVTAFTSDDFLWDYGLAWDISAGVEPTPLPGTFWLLSSGLFGLGAWKRFRKS